MKKKAVKRSVKKKSVKKKETKFDQHKLELVLALTLQTAALELTKSEYLELAPVRGMCGPFRLSGNSLPVFEYRVFDPRKKPFMMEFIKVRVEVSKPDRIHYIATIDSKGSQDPKRHGEEVPIIAKYREPFEFLSEQLFKYFPFYANPAMMRNKNRRDVPKCV